MKLSEFATNYLSMDLEYIISREIGDYRTNVIDRFATFGDIECGKYSECELLMIRPFSYDKLEIIIKENEND